MVGGEHASPTVDFLSKPLSERLEVSGRQVFVQLWKFEFRLLEELHGVEIAQGVCREVAESSHRPMHVLQHAVGVPFRHDAQL